MLPFHCHYISSASSAELSVSIKRLPPIQIKFLDPLDLTTIGASLASPTLFLPSWGGGGGEGEKGSGSSSIHE